MLYLNYANDICSKRALIFQDDAIQLYFDHYTTITKVKDLNTDINKINVVNSARNLVVVFNSPHTC